MVNFLLQHGAEVNAKTKSGYSPLHQAAQQGHTHIINLLLRNGAQPDLVTEHGNTALAIARRLGYISVVDTLKVVTLETVTTTTTMVVTTKHKINVPETMTEILEVSDDEGEDALEGDSGAYLRAEDLRELGDDSLPSSQFLDGGAAYGTGIWPTRSGSLRSFLSERSCSLARGPSSQEPTLIEEFAHIVAAPFSQHLAVPKEEEKEEEVSESRTRVSYSSELMDNVAMPSSTIHSGFLVSFMVDARGGSMRGCRHHGLRIVIPPRQCPAPTRITCRLVKRHRLATLPPLVEAEGQASRVLEVGPAGGQFLGKLHLPSCPPPLNEGESLVSRILQLGPRGTTFLGPVIVEIPHFASLRHVERELIVLRSETGETWREHQYEATQEELNQILNGMDEELDSPEQLARKHICRVVTRDFPQFFAVVSRIRQESHPFGPEGGMLSSQTVPQVQAVFPEGALTKRIRVGLQVQPVPEDLVCKILGNKASFSPIITLEPRRRKFHKPITMTLPLPETSLQDLLTGRGGTSPTLRLLCSITGGTGPAQWEDISGNTPLAFNEKCVSFTTNVSARFWLIDCRQVQEAVEFASQLYRELVCVPYLAKFVVFAKTHDPVEARLRCFCMTDDKVDKTLEHQENFTEVARSRDVEVLEGKAIYVECLGNLVPLMKAGQQHVFTFFAFKENRLPFFVKIRDSNQEKCGRLCFMKDPKSVRGLTPQAVCNLNVTLPPYRKTGSTGDKSFVSLPVRRRHGTSDDTGVGLSPPGTDKVEIRLSQLAQLLGPSWTDLARELSIGPDIVKQIEEENPNSPAEQAFCLLSQWVEFAGADGTDQLGAALTRINRLDLAELLEQQSQALHEDSLGWPTELDQTLALDHTHGLSSPTADHLPLFSPKPMTLSPTRHSFEDHSTCCPAALPDPVSPYQTLSRLHDAGRPASPSCADDPDHMDTNNLNGLEFADVDKLEQHELNDKNSPEAMQETEGAIPYMERPIISLGFQSNELFAHSTPSSTTRIPRREETEQPTLSSYSSLLVNVGSEGATTYITEDNEKSSISERYKETVEALMSPDEPLRGSWLEPIPEPESTFQEPLKNCQNSKPKQPEQDEGSNLLEISGEKEPGGGWCTEKPGFKEDPVDGLQYAFVLPSGEVEMGVPAEVSKTQGATPTEQSIESTTQESFTDSFGNIITCETKISMNVQSEEVMQNPLDHHDVLTTTTLEPATSPTLSPTTSSKMISRDSLGSN
uniref:Ankyrin-3-like n=1 Tax=Eptatretus burgeri TaxID=7764 RepID=A0A8C4R9G5_EPTBU